MRSDVLFFFLHFVEMLLATKRSVRRERNAPALKWTKTHRVKCQHNLRDGAGVENELNEFQIVFPPFTKTSLDN